MGDKKPYLTIATYPFRNAFAATSASARTKGAVTINPPGGAIAVYATTNPANIHLAEPGSNVQIEVYDPAPRVARNLVSSGLVAPVR